MTLRGVRMLLLALLAGTVALLVFGPDSKEHLRDIEKALAADKRVDWWDDAALGIRYAAWLNLGLLVALLLSSSWWGNRMADPPHPQQVPWWQDKVRWFWPVLLLVTVLGLGLRMPMASKSLWWDESWQLMQASHGRWKEDSKQPGVAVFQQHDWKRAAWYYQKPTNHAPIAVAQKASISLWQRVAGAKPSEFSHLSARAPALIGSGLSIIFLACLLRSWGRPVAGLAAGLLLALHPWALRYGVDARGYAFVLPMVSAALLIVTRLLQTRGASWPAWLGFALTEFLWLWAYPQAVFDLIAINLVLLVSLVPKAPYGQRLRMLGRIVAVNVLAATWFLQAFLPCVMQAIRWAGQETVSQPFSLALVKSLLSHLFLGVAHGLPKGVASEGLPALLNGANPWKIGELAMWVIPLVLIFLLPLAKGIFDRSLRRAPWMLLAAPIAGSLVFMTVCAITGQYFYPRFVISVTPAVLALACLVLGGGKSRWFKIILAISMSIIILPSWGAQLKVLLERPIAPLRDVVQFLQKHHTSDHAIVACFGHGREIMPLYAAEIRLISNLQEMQTLVEEAKSASRPLLIACGHEQFNQGVTPEAMSFLRNTEQFEEIAAFAGIEPEFYYRIFRAKIPSSLP